MPTASDCYRAVVAQLFLPGAIYTFVGAGGKTTALKGVAAVLAASGVKVRLTTTMRLGMDEFEGWSVTEVHTATELDHAVSAARPVSLIVGGTRPDEGKYIGLGSAMIEAIQPRADTVLLVEGDGSRKRPMKAPHGHEPVIPANTSMVFAVMGASAFDGPVEEAFCYNSEKALALLGRTGSFFEPDQIAALAGDPEGAVKGVKAGMGFHLFMNQCDIETKRETASEALRLVRRRYGIRGALVSFQRGELYETTS